MQMRDDPHCVSARVRKVRFGMWVPVQVWERCVVLSLPERGMLRSLPARHISGNTGGSGGCTALHSSPHQHSINSLSLAPRTNITLQQIKPNLECTSLSAI